MKRHDMAPRRLRRVVVAVLVATLVLASCSTGEDDVAQDTDDTVNDVGDGGTTTESAGGLPEVTSNEEARGIIHGALEGKTIAYVPIVLEADLTSLWATHLQQVFDMLGAELIVTDPAYDLDLMVNQIDSHINDQVDVLIVQNPDVGVLAEQTRRAHEEGIYVVGINVQGNQSADAFIGADYVSIAQDLGHRIVEDCQAQDKNKVAIVDGWGTDSNSISAAEGWEPVFEEAGMEIVSKQQSNYDPARGNEIAATVLQNHPDLCAFAVVWDILALGVAEAVDSAGLAGEVGVYNFDASQTWCEALRDGLVTAGGAFHAAGIGIGAGIMAQDLILNGDEPGSRRTMAYVPHTIVDIDNVDETSAACYSSS